MDGVPPENCTVPADDAPAILLKSVHEHLQGDLQCPSLTSSTPFRRSPPSSRRSPRPGRRYDRVLPPKAGLNASLAMAYKATNGGQIDGTVVVNDSGRHDSRNTNPKKDRRSPKSRKPLETAIPRGSQKYRSRDQSHPNDLNTRLGGMRSAIRQRDRPELLANKRPPCPSRTTSKQPSEPRRARTWTT